MTRPTKTRSTARSVTDNLVQIVTAQGKGTAATSNAFVYSVAVCFLDLRSFGVFRIPISFKPVLGSNAMAVKAIAARRSKDFSACPCPGMIWAFLFAIGAGVGRAQTRARRRRLNIPQQWIDGYTETQLCRTSLFIAKDRGSTLTSAAAAEVGREKLLLVLTWRSDSPSSCEGVEGLPRPWATA
jgi:hypothetical protein